ncbi:hypothetical protein F5884DRAFT_849267 [Xylogone sp. PMI_703]|nr:hypothetical protein F5884DRAFT_849267 [Xylogone sp. PMI_703]
MTRKEFIADILTSNSKGIDCISDIARGDDDGDVNFRYFPPSAQPIEIGILATDVPGYPSANTYIIFTKSIEAPQCVNDVLDQLAKTSAGMRIPELINVISQRLQIAVASDSRDDLFMPTRDSDEDDDDSILDSMDEVIEDNFDGIEEFSQLDQSGGVVYFSPKDFREINQRIKADLRAVRFAGFKIGIISGMEADSSTSILSISIRIAKLELSEEVLQAWGLDPNQYVILLMRYNREYKSLEAIISEPAKSNTVQFRIGVARKYKPTVEESIAAFSIVNKDSRSTTGLAIDGEATPKNTGYSSMFISSSLNEFLNEQFISLLKIRKSKSTSWDGAKEYLNNTQSRTSVDNTDCEMQYGHSILPGMNLPEILCGDHLVDNKENNMSFPLISIQFALRYLVRCTEFCLVCHDEVKANFEALKPYVCSKPLCLYQYMSLGFGPSVEHEILTQPYVVDLLISFCYTSAKHRRLREYPTGMSLSVPLFNLQPNQSAMAWHTTFPPQSQIQAPKLSKFHEIKFNLDSREAIFEDLTESPVHKGDWIVIVGGQLNMHSRVEDVSLYPVVQLSNMVYQYTSTQQRNEAAPTTPESPSRETSISGWVPAQAVVYDQNFDDMIDDGKANTIITLLETLPSVKEMVEYLTQQARYSEPNLKAWRDRISPAAWGVLRWIIASNRSCIVQVDRYPGQDENESANNKAKLDQRLSNIPATWVQFRFAQGSPDKEQRFAKALQEERPGPNWNHPTLFAFHGSPLQNWHSIIRHGLDFRDTVHGRAYGHGIYHSQQMQVSVGYTGGINTGCWQGSTLNVTTAMSLNEIVNKPEKFLCVEPYFVVQYTDWVQCRYLLVQVQESSEDQLQTQKLDNLSKSKNTNQDPKHVAVSTLNKPIGIPDCVTAKTAGLIKTVGKTPAKKRKQPSKPSTLNGALSDEEELADISFLLSTDDEEVIKEKKSTKGSKSKMDFIPGSLDMETLSLMEAPSYATIAATVRLNRDLQTVLKIQRSTPLDELGWYIDERSVSNVYQWIIELHSFDPSLPLAKDMKKAGVKSVVLEMRFGKAYPHSPPFIRVIRPRFLPFTRGGGGHVTAGGALCMELLTNSGWSAVSSIESVLLQVRMAISNVEPNPARLENVQGQQREYGIGEAIDAYIRACRAHNWEVPKDFQEFRAL